LIASNATYGQFHLLDADLTKYKHDDICETDHCLLNLVVMQTLDLCFTSS